MFASRAVRKIVHEALGSVPEFMDPINNQFTYGVNHPQNTTLPAALHYMEQNDYGEGAVNTDTVDDINEANFRWVVRVDGTGKSDSGIIGPAEAQLYALHGHEFDTTYNGRNVTVRFHAIGEIPMPPYNDDSGTRYQQLGTIYSVELTRGE